MQNKRSDGVLVLGVMAIVFGIWSLLYDFSSHFAFVKNPHIYSPIFESGKGVLINLAYIGSMVSIISYPLFIISGILILKLKNLGRKLLIIISAIQLVNTLVFPYIWSCIMSSTVARAMVLPTPIPILYIINIWFFDRKSVKEEFKQNK